jgi:hypothetical protein
MAQIMAAKTSGGRPYTSSIAIRLDILGGFGMLPVYLESLPDVKSKKAVPARSALPGKRGFEVKTEKLGIFGDGSG